MGKRESVKKRSGPKPRLYSLHPLEFEEALDRLLKAKPKKKGKETAEKSDQK